MGQIFGMNALRLAILPAALVAATALGACGSDDSSGGSAGSGAGTSTQQSADPVVKAAKAGTEEATKPVPAFSGPKSGPAAQKGKSVYLISCAQASSCAVETEASVQAAKELGWKTRVIDGKGNPSVYSSAIINAVNAGADGILLESIPANLIQDALRAAKAKDVPVVSIGDTVRDDDPLITSSASVDWVRQGKTAADFAIADSDGKAQVLMITDNAFPGPKLRLDTARKGLEACSGCSIVQSINLSIQDATGPRAGQVISAALNRYGTKIKYIMTPYDAIDPAAVAALRQAARTDVKIVGGVAGEQQTKLCHDGKVAATTVVALGWLGWAGADQLNRAFAGAERAKEDTLVPTFLATPQTCPSSGPAEDAIEADWKAGFKGIWAP